MCLTHIDAGDDEVCQDEAQTPIDQGSASGSGNDVPRAKQKSTVCIEMDQHTGYWKPKGDQSIYRAIPILPDKELRLWIERRATGHGCKRDSDGYLMYDMNGYLVSDQACEAKCPQECVCGGSEFCTVSSNLSRTKWFVVRTRVGAVLRQIVDKQCSCKHSYLVDSELYIA